MISELEDARAVDLELLAVLEPIQKPIAIGGLRQNPRMGVGAESRGEVEVPIVAR